MKKIFLGFAVLAFISTGFVACKGKKTEAKTEQTTEGKMDGTTTDGKMDGTTTDGKMDATNSSDGITVPNFSDASVTKWCQDYKAMLDNIIAAYSSKDMAKVTALSKDYTEWAGKASEVTMKLTAHPEEAKQFSDFITAVSAKYSQAMQANMPK